MRVTPTEKVSPMFDHGFGWERPPFSISPEKDDRLVSDPAIIEAVRKALVGFNGGNPYNLFVWLKRHTHSLQLTYKFDEQDVSQFGWNYIWVVQLSYLLTREASVQDPADHVTVELPFGVVGDFAADDLLAFHTAVFCHRLNSQSAINEGGLSRAHRLGDHFTYSVASRLVRKYKLAQIMSPDMTVDAFYVENLPSKATDFERWILNILHIADIRGEKAYHIRRKRERQRSQPKHRKRR